MLININILYIMRSRTIVPTTHQSLIEGVCKLERNVKKLFLDHTHTIRCELMSLALVHHASRRMQLNHGGLRNNQC